ncbi:MAG: hypothetical protein QNJ16_19395, partial [Rhodobacter sp.]|nr:hypothetical protein [Rhodobacter sp.]
QTFTGGSGADIFEFISPSATRPYEGVITDYEVGTDTLIVDGTTLSGLSALPAGFAASHDASSDLVISFGHPGDPDTHIHTITLQGVTETEFLL